MFCLFPEDKQFVCPPGDKHFLPAGEGGTNIFPTQGGANMCTLRGGAKNLKHEGGQTFHVLGCGDLDAIDVDEVMYVSETNFLVSKALRRS